MTDPLKKEVEVIQEERPDPVSSRGTPKQAPIPPAVGFMAPKSPRPVPRPRAKAANLTLSPEGAKFVRVQYMLDPEHKLEDVFDPEYWAHVADRFEKPMGEGDYCGSIIELRYPDHSMYAELFVRAVQKKALVVALKEVFFFGPKATVSKHYMDRWNPGKKKFEVIRKIDGECVFESKVREKCEEYIKGTKE